ncbi:response regulator [Dyadobacter sp. NIV53]|uniref:response regulator n=1 Tax=Dyadobacter sp. NIV53 TaxID=2861765 RepID=UPI001C889C61|nr:response regulator [Dyadobacter sp. NIV53]
MTAPLAFCQENKSSLSLPEARLGVLDLRNTNFYTADIPVKGQWKFFWNTLKEPSENIEYFEYAELPRLWKDTVWKNKKIPSQGIASYEVKILLPKVKEHLALKIPDAYSSYNLYVNNKLFATNGKPGETKETTIPYWSTQVIPLLETSDTLNLLLQIANFHHYKGGVNRNIEIGLFSNLKRESDIDHASDYFLTGSIFMGGLFFLGLYLFGRHDKSILYFALFCLCYSYRIGGAGQYSLHDVFPYLSWNFTLHCEYLSLYLAVAMFALYTRSLYPEDAPQKIMSIMTGICFGFITITIISPPVLFTRLINYFIIIVLVYVVFATYIYWIAVRNKRIGSKYALLSTAAIFIIIISDTLEYYHITTPDKEILFFGYLGFFFCQSLILSFKFATTLKKAKEEAEIGLKVKSEFLSTMSHEIRTPLNSVIGMTHLMMKETPRPDQRQNLDVMLFSANNLLTIVNDVLDFSTIEEGKIVFTIGPMDISMIARNILLGYKATTSNPGINFILDLDKTLPSKLSGDSARTTQIIDNLVHNACKFTASGFIRLAINEESRNEKEITLKISVEDTGIGIPADKQKMIFERFTQADSSFSRGFSGTGLGLAISKRILEVQGIELLLKSEENKGSVFYFTQTFQIIQEELKLPQTLNLPLSGVQILIVEDNPMNVLVLKKFLRRWGAESEVAENGEEAVNKLDPSKHQIILMDLHMPVMDGYEATKVLRSRGETVPIIALTASVALDVEKDIYGIGINAIIFKPFIPDNLLQTISNHVFAAPSVQ